MNIHKNAPLTPKGREAMVRAWSKAGLPRPRRRASSTRHRRPSPNGSSASARKVLKVCAIAPQDLFHRQAKPRPPHAPPSRRCAGSATPASRLPPRSVCRRQLSAASFGGSVSTGSQRWSRPSRSGATSARQPGELIHIDIKKLGRFKRIGHRITGDRTGQNKSRGAGWEFVHVAIDDASRIAFSQVMQNEKRQAPSPSSRRPSPTTRASGKGRAVMTDNGSCYRSFAFAEGLQAPSPQAHPHQALHAQDQRQGRTLHPDSACANGPMPTLTTPQTNAPTSCQDGFIATIGTDLTAAYNLKHRSADSV